MKPEVDTVAKWDTWNGTKFKKDLENGKKTSKEIAQNNHKVGLDYEFSAMYEDDTSDFPFCFVSVVPENKFIGVEFMDGVGRKYLKYSFGKNEDKNLLFLEEIWFYEFANEDTDKMKSRTHFVFDEVGNVNYRVYDMIQGKTLDYESKEPMETSALYEPYPEFGEYEGVIRLERDIPILKDNVRTYIYKNGTRYYKDEDDNLIENN
ncbi:hypothetical protein [Lacinutrix mariniflava]|uniref:hypothetical protein n=1 Tax=Lacinutrix mariniflava TaxID=342955 RepID=UPI0006E1AD0B|nr:hypothetical protein [Lacinutrix mariniflava]